MKTPAEALEIILDEFTVENGIIRNPGRFECEPVWVPYFWELVCEGEGEDELDEDGEVVQTAFMVDYEEEDVFGLQCGTVVAIRQDAQGFVIGTAL